MDGHDKQQLHGNAMERGSESDAIADLGPWFHNLHLPGGRQTAPEHPLGDFPAFKWEQLARHLPENLTGWRALDLGCNAGFYSFELARRGAEVTGIDVDAHYLRQARWAAREYGLEERVAFRRMQIYDVVGMARRFDLVLFMGLFYHLRYPLLGLDIIARTVRRLLVFQTLTTEGEEVYPDIQDHTITDRAPLQDPGWPKLAFIEHRFAGDPTNWWVPNHAAVEALLRSSGMEIIGRPGHEIYLCRPALARNNELAAHCERQFRSATGRPWRDPRPGGRGDRRHS